MREEGGQYHPLLGGGQYHLDLWAIARIQAFTLNEMGRHGRVLSGGDIILQIIRITLTSRVRLDSPRSMTTCQGTVLIIQVREDSDWGHVLAED